MGRLMLLFVLHPSSRCRVSDMGHDDPEFRSRTAVNESKCSPWGEEMGQPSYKHMLKETGGLGFLVSGFC